MNASLPTLIRKYRANHRQIFRESCKELGNLVVYRTPVGTPEAETGGTLQASWNASINASFIDNIEMDQPDASIPANQVDSVADMLETGDVFFMVNGQPYFHRIEYEGWSHIKAPNGMMRISMAEFPQIVYKYARQSLGS